VVILALAPALGCAGADQAVREPWRNLDRVPTELRMVMNPGVSGKAIVFRTDDGEQVKGEYAGGPQRDADQAPAELRMVLDPGESGNAVIFAADSGYMEESGQGASGRMQPAEPFSFTDSGSAVEDEPAGSGASWDGGYQPQFTLSAGYRNDSLNWSIADTDNSPNILSELTFDDIDAVELAGAFRWSHSSRLYLRGGVNLGLIVDGKARDSDYLGDDRTLEFSRSYADIDDGTLFDATVGVGYRFEMPLSSTGSRLHLIPLAGYSYHLQEVEMTHGRQVVADYGFEMDLGPFDGLESTYETEWLGPWLGLDLELELNRRHTLRASFEYHWADYEADGNWNLREDFQHPVSFSHDADGDGIVASIDYLYRISPEWSWTMGFDYRRLTTDSGEDETYFYDGSEGSTRLNEAEWESYSIDVGLSYHF
jgi:outer membrane protease